MVNFADGIKYYRYNKFGKIENLPYIFIIEVWGDFQFERVALELARIHYCLQIFIYSDVFCWAIKCIIGVVIVVQFGLEHTITHRCRVES